MSVTAQSGQVLSVSQGQDFFLENHGVIHFTFDTAQADFVRDGLDLVITQNQATTIIHDFFKDTGEGELPQLKLADGATFAGKSFLLAYDPNFDIATAAGPQTAPSSSGFSAYNDAAGETVTGVSVLDALVQTDAFTRTGPAVTDQIHSSGVQSFAAIDTDRKST